MKTIKFLSVILLSGSLFFTSCEAIKNTSSGVKGGAIGTGAGAAVGAGVGALAGSAGWGAAIGAVVGGTAGALIGNKMDRQRKELEAIEGAKVETANNGEAIKVTFESGILFSTNKSDLSSESKNSLNKFASSLKNNPETVVEVLGFTDSSGSDKVNIPLSEKRAQAVKNYLAAEGVPNARVRSAGKGSLSPVADNSSATGKAQNRRVEVYILASENMIEQAHRGSLK